MVKSVKYIISGNGNITLWIHKGDGNVATYSVATDSPNHKRIVEKLKQKDYEGLEELAIPAKGIENALRRVSSTSLVGTAEIRDRVYVNNVPVHNVISERILDLFTKGYPVDPILRFLENVLMNPSSQAQEELYDFLVHKDLPLTEDGCFLAYKRIREDWKDIYTGTIDNSIGSRPSVPRDSVDSDRTRECSRGLHVGSIEYVRWYHPYPGTRVVVVKVNPMNCVSVPLDHNRRKLRVCEYEVLYELSADAQIALNLPVYTSDGKSLNPSYPDLPEKKSDGDFYWEDGWDDYDDEDDESWNDSNCYYDDSDYWDCSSASSSEDEEVEEDELEDNSESEAADEPKRKVENDIFMKEYIRSDALTKERDALIKEKHAEKLNKLAAGQIWVLTKSLRYDFAVGDRVVIERVTALCVQLYSINRKESVFFNKDIFVEHADFLI